MKTEHLREFLIESNKIEGITEEPSGFLIQYAKDFLEINKLRIAHLESFVAVFQPGAILRDKPGMDVQVGNHRPPRGGGHIVDDLVYILGYMVKDIQIRPYTVHARYKNLHPFSDGNGRSGRMLWLWQMVNQGHGYRPEWGFLQHFYFQSLEHGR